MEKTVDILSPLEATLRGKIIRVTDGAIYEEARHLWNLIHNIRPKFIVRIKGVSDIIKTLKFARENNIKFVVRGAGHSFAGRSSIEGGLVIDLNELNSVRVDTAEKTAWVEMGATWADVDAETTAFGLYTPGGTVSSTGMGLALGGGIGWATRKYGMVADNILAADVILADGTFLHVDDKNHSDIFWGIRGGGGNFGVVAQIKLQLHDCPPEVYGGYMWWEIKDLRTFYKVTSNLPKTISHAMPTCSSKSPLHPN